MLDENELAELAAAETDGRQQAEFAPALEDIARDDHGQARAAEEQSQSAERLEDREVGILHGLKFAEPRAADVSSSPRSCSARESSARTVSAFSGRAIDEEKAVAALPGKLFDEASSSMMTAPWRMEPLTVAASRTLNVAPRSSWYSMVSPSFFFSEYSSVVGVHDGREWLRRSRRCEVVPDALGRCAIGERCRFGRLRKRRRDSKSSTFTPRSLG